MFNKRKIFEVTALTSAALVSGLGGLLLFKQNVKKTDALSALWHLTLPTPEGTDYRLASLKGRHLLINFWATWCPPCVEELPLLNAFYLEHAQSEAGSKKSTKDVKSLQMLGIAADKASSVFQFLKKMPLDFPIVLAGFDGIALAQQLGSTTGGLPFTVWIAPDGSILFTKEGQLTTDDLQSLKSRFLSA
jgi:thiol-disulfide isomerase/thioredoxin